MVDLGALGRCNEFTKTMVCELIYSFDGDCIYCDESRARFCQLILSESSSLKSKYWERYEPSWRAVLKALAIVREFTWRQDAEDQAYFNRRIVEVLIVCVKTMAWERLRTGGKPQPQQKAQSHPEEEDIAF